MTHLLLVVGGARSGKSAYAEQRVAGCGATDVVYVATMLPGEPDVDARIAAHRARRPTSWATVEAGGELVAAVRQAAGHSAVLLDGFDLAVALAHLADDDAATRLAGDVGTALREGAPSLAVVVSAEVGMGVVPSSAAGVAFRDRLGAANQALAAGADEVVLVVAGLPLWLKGAPG
ncbi:MAG TPA: bifunctional adenosylcobinamide kinase/adenosylcobinamide-phosphate guanylyltransferase [Candidatus Dormibacteraeota bacterium]|nr:bifunctional adenosylcobinamide kinase/adenosylcobinamide-phosphate guanylyltransferase [Candidatus Dormibacteraeota bacterium]